MKGAFIVGVDNYPGTAKLHGCVNDAVAVARLLETNGDSSTNFSVVLMKNVQTRAELRANVIKLFQAYVDTGLFYFSGHGCITERGGFIVTPDFRHYDEGISMDEILTIANQSGIKEKIVIIDCCHSGALGNPTIVGGTSSFLSEGVTILTATRQHESAIEINGHGIFTSLLLTALEGGAADLLGNISLGNIYSYIDRSLSFWEQRPQFKTNISRFNSLRNVEPLVPRKALKNIIKYFAKAADVLPLDPTYEYTNIDIAVPRNVVIMKELQKMQSSGLVTPIDEEFMYWAAQKSGACKLTQLGMHYWKLVSEGKI